MIKSLNKKALKQLLPPEINVSPSRKNERIRYPKDQQFSQNAILIRVGIWKQI